MGLFYQFPHSEDKDHFLKNDKKLILRTYGPPYIFWFYLLSILLILCVMFIAIRNPIEKMLLHAGPIESLFLYFVLSLFLIIPLTLIILFFYEKMLLRSDNFLEVKHRLFGFTVFKKSYPFSPVNLFIRHFMDSPNLSRIEKGPKQYQNRGYFEMLYKFKGKNILIDRSSQKRHLEKIKEAISSF